jgi:hypothetical protein
LLLEIVPPSADKCWRGTKIARRPYKQGSYSKQEIALLKEWHPATSAAVLAAKLKRSLVSVQ